MPIIVLSAVGEEDAEGPRAGGRRRRLRDQAVRPARARRAAAGGAAPRRRRGRRAGDRAPTGSRSTSPPASVRRDGEEVHLTPIEFELLRDARPQPRPADDAPRAADRGLGPGVRRRHAIAAHPHRQPAAQDRAAPASAATSAPTPAWAIASPADTRPIHQTGLMYRPSVVAGDRVGASPRRASCGSPAIRCAGGCSASWRAAIGGSASSCALVGQPAEPRLLPPRATAGRGAGVACAAARPTGATPTTASISRAAASCWRDAARRCIPACGWYRGAPRRRARRGRRARACCSCAPATAPARRWPRRCSSSIGGGSVEAVSAGSHPKPLHPNAVRVMRERGIDITGRRSKHLDEFAGAALRLRDHASAIGCARSAPSSRATRELDPLEHPRPGAEGATDARPTPRSSAPPTELDDAHPLPARSRSIATRHTRRQS